MFLIRVLFWLSVVILLLPAENPSSTSQMQADSNARVDAVHVIDAARTTVSDLAGICERSPQVCETSSAAFHTFLRKARYGAALVYEMIYGATPETAPTGQPQPEAAGQAAQWTLPPREAMAPMSRNTLQPSDLEPEWTGPDQDRSV